MDNSTSRGNHVADDAAKIGAEARNDEALIDPRDVPYRQLSAVKYDLMQLLRKEWNRRWTLNEKDARETKLWFPEINSRKSFELMHQRSRFDFSILVQAITGFNHLSNHNARLDKMENTSRKCTICKASVLTGQFMTTNHIFTECDALARYRLRIFGTHEPIISQLTVSQTIRFLTETAKIIPWLPEGYHT